MEVATSTRVAAFSVRFQSLETWSVAAQFAVNWNWPDEIIKPLASVLTRRHEAALDSLSPDSKVTLLTIRFDGSIEPRDPIRIQDMKGKLFRVYPGDVVFSKIDVRNGAIGLAPDNIDVMCVTSEFPVYAVCTKTAHPEYVKLLFRTVAFKKMLNSMISGASGRKRIQPSQLESVKVPIPPLPVQQKIVAYWEKAQTQEVTLANRIKEREKKMEVDFLDMLGLDKPQKTTLARMFVMEWKSIERWSIKYNQLSKTAINLDVGKFPVRPLGEVANVLYGIQKTPANRPGSHPRPYLRVANVRRGSLNLDEIKLINVPDSELKTYRLEDGDLLFVEGNGSRAELGRCAIWKNEIPDCVHQNHIIKVRTNSALLHPMYAMVWFNSSAGKQHFFNNVKSSSGLGSINSSELRAAPIPLPPLKIQQTIIAKVEQEHLAIAEIKSQRRNLKKSSCKTVEKLILGTLSVEEI